MFFLYKCLGESQLMLIFFLHNTINIIIYHFFFLLNVYSLNHYFQYYRTLTMKITLSSDILNIDKHIVSTF